MGMLTRSVMREEKAVIAMQNESIHRRNAGNDVFDNDGTAELAEFTSTDPSATRADFSAQSDNDDESFNENYTNDSESNDAERRTNSKRILSLRREASFKLERTKRIFRQAFLYVGICYITWFIPTMGVLIARNNGEDDLIVTPPFFILVVTCIFQPMQGFWNSLGK